MKVKRIVRWSIVLLLLAALPGLTAALGQGQEGTLVAGCDLIVAHSGDYNYYTINEALNALKTIPEDLPYGYTICLRDGVNNEDVYNEKVWIVDDDQDDVYQLRGLRLIAEPDGDSERPVIDGTGIYFRSWYDGLIMIRESGITIEGIEVRNSHGRGIFIYGEDAHLAYSGDEPNPDPDEMQGDTIHDILLSNLSVHHNWTDGIVANGQDQAEVTLDGVVTEPVTVHRYYPTNIVVRDSEIYNNAQKARAMPVVFEGRRIREVPQNASAWQFIGNGLDPWNKPFWQGRFINDLNGSVAHKEDMAFFPHEDLDAISVQLDAGNELDTMLVSPQTEMDQNLALDGSLQKKRLIPGHRTASGANLWFGGADIVQFDPDSALWGMYFNGDFLKDTVQCPSLDVDGFEVTTDGQLLLSFRGCASFKLPDTPETTFTAYPSDLLLFTGTLGPNTSGTFSHYLDQDYHEWGLGSQDNLFDFALDPSGGLVGRIKKQGFEDKVTRELFWFDISTRTWLPYMHMELQYPLVSAGQPAQYQFNPIGNGIQAVSIRGELGEPRLFLGGKVEGAVGLGFTATGSSIADNNRVYENYGEGLSSFFNARNTTVTRNVIYNQLHGNLYVNNVQAGTVDSNFVYCNDDHSFWDMTEQTGGHHPQRGIAIQDEVYGGENRLDANSKTEPSSHITIMNNIVAGCMNNFYFSKNDGSPGKNEPASNINVLHNTLVYARGDVAGYGNVVFTAKINPTGDYFVDSVFANNLITQPDCPMDGPGVICYELVLNDTPPVGLSLHHNLYLERPTWDATPEVGRVIGDPLLRNPVAPSVGSMAAPEDYQIAKMGSPARNHGAVIENTPVALDFFGNPRNVDLPDIGAHEMPPPDHVMAIGDKVTGNVGQDQGLGEIWSHTIEFHMDTTSYVLIDIKKTGGLGRLKVELERGVGGGKLDEIETEEGLIFQTMYRGYYYIHVFGIPASGSGDASAYYELALSSPMLISAAATGLREGGDVAGIHFYSEDILAYSKMNGGEERWRMFFDGSDVGLTRNVTNIAALQYEDNYGNDILIGLAANQNLLGVGNVTPHDIIRFNPTSYGPTTDGTFSIFLQGAYEGLTTIGERIDAIDGGSDGWFGDDYDYCSGYAISTVGTAKLPTWAPLTERNEDVFCMYTAQDDDWGWQWWGWVNYFDGTGVSGLAQENVFALATDDARSLLYRTLANAGTIDGHPVTTRDIIAIKMPDHTWDSYVWRGVPNGWNYKIDAIEYSGW